MKSIHHTMIREGDVLKDGHGELFVTDVDPARTYGEGCGTRIRGALSAYSFWEVRYGSEPGVTQFFYDDETVCWLRNELETASA